MGKSETRQAVEVISVRCTSEQREALEQAAGKLVADIPGAKMALSSFLLTAALARAADLGFTPKKR